MSTNFINFLNTGPWPTSPAIQSSENFPRTFSNITLKCSIEVDPENCGPPTLRWYLNNISEPLKSSEKYKIEERKTHSKCKKDFILTIVNLTENDKGTYGCHSLCEWGNSSAAFELKVFHEPPGKSVLSMSLQTFKQRHLGLKLVGCLVCTELLADWLTGRQTDRQTGRQTDEWME